MGNRTRIMERQVKYILASGAETIISEIDFEFVLTSRQSWILNAWGYITRHNKKREYLHKLIAQRMGLNTNDIIDHINRNKVDNSRPNLRESTPSLNRLNSKIQSNNTSGIAGISFHNGRYKVGIGKSIYLGCFENKEDAIAARILAESKIQW